MALRISRLQAPLGALAIAGLLALTACSDSEGSAATPTPTDAASTSGTEGGGAPTPAARLSKASIKTLAAYSGAEPGAADETANPVKVGAVNADSGPLGQPELTEMLESAIGLLNEQLGGIEGRPIELVTCDVNSEETGLSCAQQFANDNELVAVIQNSTSLGSASFHSVMDTSGIPIISALPLTMEDAAAPNSYDTSAGAFASVGGMITVALEAYQATSVALIGNEGDPVASQIINQMVGVLDGLGIEVKQATLSANEADPTAALIAAGVTEADVIIPAVVTPPQCLSTAKVLEQLQTDAPVLGLVSCYSTVVAEALGDYPKWTYLYGFVNPEAEVTDTAAKAQVAAYLEWWKPLKSTNPGVIPLQTALTVQRHILAAGGTSATSEDVAAAAKAWKGPIFLGPTEVSYGTPPFVAVPTLNAMLAYEYEGDGAWTTLLDGRWFGAPPA